MKKISIISALALISLSFSLEKPPQKAIDLYKMDLQERNNLLGDLWGGGGTEQTFHDAVKLNRYNFLNHQMDSLVNLYGDDFWWNIPESTTVIIIHKKNNLKTLKNKQFINVLGRNFKKELRK